MTNPSDLGGKSDTLQGETKHVISSTEINTCLYPLHIQTPMQSSNARQVMIEIGQIYDIYIVLAKSDEPHIYNTYINTYMQLVCRPQWSC